MRSWWEVDLTQKWCLYTNGGEYRKWYGNYYDVVDWSPEARDFYATHGGLLPKNNWEVEGITWSDITSGLSSYRIKPREAKFSSNSPTLVSTSGRYDYTMLAFLNSNVVAWMNEITNPTLHTLVGNILSLPDKIAECDANSLSIANVELSKNDWDAFEISHEFKKHPLI